MAEKKELFKVASSLASAVAPADLISKAIEGKADLDKLEKLLTLQERFQANEAKKAYNKAMALFKEKPPKIDKDKTVSFGVGKTSYNHASLANVTEKINTELSKYGLSASWNTKQNGQIIVTCRITHELGHSEETSLSAPADTSGSKNAIQAIGSTITYLERYTLLALTGLATYDQDDDATGVVEYINEKEKEALMNLAIETNTDKDKLLGHFKFSSIDEIPKSEYKKIMVALETKKLKMQDKK